MLHQDLGPDMGRGEWQKVLEHARCSCKHNTQEVGAVNIPTSYLKKQAQRGKVTCLESYCFQVAKPGLRPGF